MRFFKNFTFVIFTLFVLPTLCSGNVLLAGNFKNTATSLACDGDIYTINISVIYTDPGSREGISDLTITNKKTGEKKLLKSDELEENIFSWGGMSVVYVENDSKIIIKARDDYGYINYMGDMSNISCNWDAEWE